MSERPADTDLRARFEAQRRAEAGTSPSFAAMMAAVRAEAAAAAPVAVPRRFTRRRLLYASGLAAAAVIAAVLVIPRVPSGQAEFERAVQAFENDPALSAWQSPTDRLLDVPGAGLLTSVPGIDTPQ